MLVVRTRQLTTEDFHLIRRAALSAAPTTGLVRTACQTINLATSCRRASLSWRLSGACCSPHEVAHEAEPQRLKGYLYTPRSYDIPPCRFHGAPIACHNQRGACFFPT